MQKERSYLALVSFQIRVVHGAIRACRITRAMRSFLGTRICEHIAATLLLNKKMEKGC